MAVKKQKFISFKIAGDWYGLPIIFGKQFINCEQLSPIPDSQDKIKGLIYHNGNILTVLDTAKIISIKARPSDRTQVSCLVFSYDKDFYALAINEEGEVMTAKRIFNDANKQKFKKYFKEKDAKIYILEPADILHSIDIYDK